MVDAAEGGDARDAPPGSHDHLAVDPLADQPVRAADVVRALGGDGRRLDPQAGLDHRGRGLLADAVPGGAAILEGKIEALLFNVEPDHARVEYAQGLLEQLLAGLVPFEHDYREPGHGARG